MSKRRLYDAVGDREVLEQAMHATAAREFAYWTRPTVYLPKYRITPPRKFSWQVRGLYELMYA